MEVVLSGMQTARPRRRSICAVARCVLGELASLQQTMGLLDEWQAPEPSPYFATRLQARMREECCRRRATGSPGCAGRRWPQWQPC